MCIYDANKEHKFNLRLSVTMASKQLVADVNKGEKLDGDNFDIWHRKIRYVLDEQEVNETLNQVMEQPGRR